MGADKADVIKHLEMLQGVINRMAANSFVVKGWSVTLAAALAAFGAQSANQWFVAFGLIPVAAFWGLDAYYLPLMHASSPTPTACSTANRCWP